MKLHLLPSLKRWSDKIIHSPLSFKVTMSLLVIVWLFITLINFPFTSYFSGWDNLHPEFNPLLNFMRAFYGVWQEHEGLGHVGGHGYAATLPYSLIVAFVSIFLNQMFIRSAMTFLMLLLGTLGSYFLIAHVLRKESHFDHYILAFVGALFYMLNYGTVQQFYVQLEAFTVHFAALPWLILLILRLLSQWNKSNLAVFIVVSFLSSTQGFIPPVFVAYSVFAALLLSGNIVQHRSVIGIKRSILIGIVIIATNAYWLFPFSYYTLKDTHVFLNSNNNLLSTNSWVDANNRFGTLNDLAVLRGFHTEALDYVEDKGQVFIFEPWIAHQQQPYVSTIGYGLFVIILIGFVRYMIYTRKNKTELAIGLFALLIFSMLAARIPILEFVSKTLMELPILRQAFRTGFTKLSLALALTYSLFLPFGIIGINTFIQKVFRNRFFFKINAVTTIIVALSIGVFSYPAFQGNFLYKKAHLTIPSAYFEVFNFMKTQPSTDRIMLLPQGDHWGWNTHRWGYSGSGFLAFGLQQSILERAYDVWSNFSENYYWELSYALFSNRYDLFEALIDKYQIDWILFDDSVISYQGTKTAVYAESVKRYLTTSPKMTKISSWPLYEKGLQTVSLYRTKLAHASIAKVSVTTNINRVIPTYDFTQVDRATNAFLPYTSEIDNNSFDVYFPFRTLFTNRVTNTLDFSIEEKGSAFIAKTLLPQELKGTNLVLPHIKPTDFPEVDLNSEAVINSYSPDIYLDGSLILNHNDTNVVSEIQLPEYERGTLEIVIPKLSGTTSYLSTTDSHFLDEPIQCDQKKMGVYDSIIISASNSTGHRLSNTNSSTCKDIFIGSLLHRFGYLIKIKHRHEAGNDLTFYLINRASGRNDITTILSTEAESPTDTYLIVPPMENDQDGYSLRFDNNSQGDYTTINELLEVSVNPFPFDYLSSIEISPATKKQQMSTFLNVDVQHPSPAHYWINFTSDSNTQPNQTLILYQSFHEGWVAYEMPTADSSIQNWLNQRLPFIFGKRLTEHVMVNNWANGWKFDDTVNTQERNIYIFFWPQLLEYLGFAMLLIPLLILIKKK